MWIRWFRILWVKVSITEGRHFYLNFPVCLNVFQELFDCVLDLMEFACIFVPKNPSAHSPSTVTTRQVKELIHATDKLFHSITDCEPYDIVEVSVKNVSVSIKIV